MTYYTFIWGCNKIQPSLIFVANDLDKLKKIISEKVNKESFDDFAQLLSEDDEYLFLGENFAEFLCKDNNDQTCLNYKLNMDEWNILYEPFKKNNFNCNTSCQFLMTIFKNNNDIVHTQIYYDLLNDSII